jgi:methylated-DNA-[protein]-cysteine S-methyltransferase
MKFWGCENIRTMKYYWIERTDYGDISAIEEAGVLIRVFLPQRKKLTFPEGEFEKRRTPLLRDFLKSMKSYFNHGKFCDFSIYPVRFPSSHFRKEVSRFLKDNVKWGKILTYKELGKEIGFPHAARAVGNALSLNETPLIVPCHRVISKKGLGGFSGGLKLKRIMLSIEGVKI